MFYRTNKIIVAGFGLLILALTANVASGQYCIGSTRYIVRGKNGKKLSDAEMKKVVIKTINGEKAILRKDELGRVFYEIEKEIPKFYSLVAPNNPLKFGMCGEIKDLTLIYKNAEMQLIFDIGEHNTRYDIDSLPFQAGTFRLMRKKDATYWSALECAEGKSPPLIDNNTTGVCSVSADNWKSETTKAKKNKRKRKGS